MAAPAVVGGLGVLRLQPPGDGPHQPAEEADRQPLASFAVGAGREVDAGDVAQAGGRDVAVQHLPEGEVGRDHGREGALAKVASFGRDQGADQRLGDESGQFALDAGQGLEDSSHGNLLSVRVRSVPPAWQEGFPLPSPNPIQRRELGLSTWHSRLSHKLV